MSLHETSSNNAEATAKTRNLKQPSRRQWPNFQIMFLGYIILVLSILVKITFGPDFIMPTAYMLTPIFIFCTNNVRRELSYVSAE
jgi:hypothetical protein